MLSAEEYEEFIHLNKEVGLIPQIVKTFRNKRGNCLIVPRGLDRHTVYTTLCLYRWADSKVRAMRTALQIFHQTKLPWLQVLHYVVTRRNLYGGHSFMPTDYITHTKDSRLDLGSGPALAQFGFLSLEERDRINQKANTSQIIAEICGNIQSYQLKKTGSWGKKKIAKYYFKDKEDILNPFYSILYTTKGLTRSDFCWILESQEK